MNIKLVLNLIFFFRSASGALEEVFQHCFVTENKCPNENITFWLYTNKTQTHPSKLDVTNLGTEEFLPKKDLVIILHAFAQSKDGAPNEQIRPILLTTKAPYVISVDYAPLARLPCFKQAVENIQVVAKCLGELINALLDQKIFTKDDIHIIGFSLGAQGAGLTSKYVNQKIKRITGLDPTKLRFTFVDHTNRLDPSDAEFVDVIHTSVLPAGILEPPGHVNFYPNAGKTQPGCDLKNVTIPALCNHSRAPQYFAESITSEIGFYGFKCQHWFYYIRDMCKLENDTETEIMGYDTPPTARGSYFLETNSQPLYARGKEPVI